MPGRRGDILQYTRLRVGVVDNHVQPAIAIQIGNCETTSTPGVSQPASRRGAHTLELAVFQIAKKQRLLSIARSPLIIVDDRVNMPIRDNQIQPTVIVIIKKAGPPTKKWKRALAEPAEISDVSKISIPIIVKKHIKITEEVCDLKTDPTRVDANTDANS